MVHRVFTGRGHGIAQILGGQVTRKWLHENGIHPLALPRDLTAGQWAALYERSVRRS
jgi:23S rRNA (adenine-N6)-dimethyltransferase